MIFGALGMSTQLFLPGDLGAGAVTNNAQIIGAESKEVNFFFAKSAVSLGDTPDQLSFLQQLSDPGCFNLVALSPDGRRRGRAAGASLCLSPRG